MTLTDGGFLSILSAALASLLFVRASLRFKNISNTSTPYTTFGHPHKFLLDILLGLVFQLIVPMKVMRKYSIRNVDEVSSQLQLVRERMELFDLATFSPFCLLWNRLLRKNATAEDDFLVGGTVTVPRESDILLQWRIVKECDDNGTDVGGDVEIEVTCPRSVVMGKIRLKNGGKTNWSGYKEFERCSIVDLNLSSTAPFLLWFHGGVMTIGGARDASSLFAFDLCRKQFKKVKNDANGKRNFPPLIFASVSYRLAPEHPFPASIIDSLSAAKFVIEKLPHPSLHIAGFSAGGNLSAVVGLECFRRYPGAVKSIVCMDPWTISEFEGENCRMNAPTSLFCPISFCRYCTGAYLQLRGFDVEDEASYTSARTERVDVNAEVDVAVNPMLRLLSPHRCLPDTIGSGTEAVPKIIVKTCTADPLQDGGLDIIRCFRDAGTPVTSIESFGSHGLSSLLDFKTRHEMVEVWGESLWD